MESALLYIPRTRLIWMDCPTPERVVVLAGELEWHHEEHYMVWNVAGSGPEPAYEPEAFGGRVVQLRYPGHLCPTLQMLVEACASIHAWLRADPANFVAVHCRSGRGRSAVLLSCVAAFLSMVSGEAAGPTSPVDWLSRLATLRGEDEAKLTLPTHRRYLQYFGQLLRSGPAPGSDHGGCELRGVTLHNFPALRTPPCVQLTCGTRTLFVSVDGQDAELPDATIEPARRLAYSYRASPKYEEPVSWPLLRSDIVLTVREESRSGPLLCRAGFHVDFSAGDGVLRLPCAALDGASSRLPADCFIDLILVPRPPEPGTKGSGGLLGTAVEELRRAGVASGDKDAAHVWGGAKQPTALFTFGDDDNDGDDGDDVDDDDDDDGRSSAEVSAKQLNRLTASASAAVVLAAEAAKIAEQVAVAEEAVAEVVADDAMAVKEKLGGEIEPAAPAQLASVAEATTEHGALVGRCSIPVPQPTTAQALSPAAAATAHGSSKNEEVARRCAELKAEAQALRASGDKQGAVAKVREMKSLNAGGAVAMAATSTGSAKAVTDGSALSPNDLLTKYAASPSAVAAPTAAAPPLSGRGGDDAVAAITPGDEAPDAPPSTCARTEGGDANEAGLSLAGGGEATTAHPLSAEELEACSLALDAQIAAELEGVELDSSRVEGDALPKMGNLADVDAEFDALFK
jgi:hypothetical protein